MKEMKTLFEQINHTEEFTQLQLAETALDHVMAESADDHYLTVATRAHMHSLANILLDIRDIYADARRLEKALAAQLKPAVIDCGTI
jgi:hypothetical protein